MTQTRKAPAKKSAAKKAAPKKAAPRKKEITQPTPKTEVAKDQEEKNGKEGPQVEVMGLKRLPEDVLKRMIVTTGDELMRRKNEKAGAGTDEAAGQLQETAGKQLERKQTVMQEQTKLLEFNMRVLHGNVQRLGNVVTRAGGGKVKVPALFNEDDLKADNMINATKVTVGQVTAMNNSLNELLNLLDVLI